MILRPVMVDPVKLMRSTSVWAASAAPAVGPGPGTTLTTPAGTPASCRISAIISAESGASSAGFSTSVQPEARVGQMLHSWVMSGPFHGMIAPITPSGTFCE